jgi:hypothetical protein
VAAVLVGVAEEEEVVVVVVRAVVEVVGRVFVVSTVLEKVDEVVVNRLADDNIVVLLR